MKLVEIRTYKLKPASGAQFHRLMETESMPLLAEFGMDVVGYGPSAGEPDSYVLMRAFHDSNHLTASQDEFYASDVWRNGPRAAVLALIEEHLSVSVWLSDEAIELIRDSFGSAPTTSSTA